MGLLRWALSLAGAGGEVPKPCRAGCEALHMCVIRDGSCDVLGKKGIATHVMCNYSGWVIWLCDNLEILECEAPLCDT